MPRPDRRAFIAAALAIGADAAWAGPRAFASTAAWTERRDLYPQGVASGDPDAHSVILWTRRPFDEGGAPGRLDVEVAEDPDFRRVVATAKTRVEPEADWTCRVMVGGLKPGREYWYRFADAKGFASRVGRTITAPATDDPRAVRFAFVSCQNANQGAQNAYRRMIWEDERAAPEDRLGFVLHLGDFIYEIVWYPPDRPQGMYDRRLRDIVRYPDGEKIDDFHVPTTVAGYRAIYAAYLGDPDLQDARARWPFVTMWDNHEYSWQGWQSLQVFDGKTRPAQTRKVAANQAWYEFHPGRVSRPGGLSLERFDPPKVADTPITRFDDAGLGQEPNNLAALASLTGYRVHRWGPHVDLIITDQRSYRSQDPFDRPETDPLGDGADVLGYFPEDTLRVIDAGRAFEGDRPPEAIRARDKSIANFRRGEPAQTILGAEQKAWFLDRLAASRATWKLWGNTIGTLDSRADLQNLPAGMAHAWPAGGFGVSGGGDFATAYAERAQIYDFVADRKITGFASLSGDRHSFWAGLSAKALPPARFEPVGLAFVTGSISAPGMLEAQEHKLPKDHPLRALFLVDRPGQARPEPSVNMLTRHGVRSVLDYAAHADLAKARVLSNPDLAPHLSFVDMGGHGYAVVRAGADRLDVEFVCIPRPIERAPGEDGGPIRYRVVHSARLWGAGERPRLTQTVAEGDPGLAI